MNLSVETQEQISVKFESSIFLNKINFPMSSKGASFFQAPMWYL